MHNIIILPNGHTVSEDDLDSASTMRANFHNGLALLIEPLSRSCAACRKKRVRCIHEEGFACRTCRGSQKCIYANQVVETRSSNGGKRRKEEPARPRIRYEDYPRLLPKLYRAEPIEDDVADMPTKKRRPTQQARPATVATPQSMTHKSAGTPAPRVRSSPSPDPLDFASPSARRTPRAEDRTPLSPRARLGPSFHIQEVDEGDYSEGGDSDDVSIKTSSSTRHISLAAETNKTRDEGPSLPALSAQLSSLMAYISRVEPLCEAGHAQAWSVGELTHWANTASSLPMDINETASIALENLRAGQAQLAQSLERAKKEAKVLMDAIARRL